MALPPHKARNLTPKHLVGFERDRMLNRFLLWGTIGVVAIVIGLVGYAIARETWIIPNQTVAIVEGHEISGHDFQARVKINRTQLVSNYVSYYQTMQMFGTTGDPNFTQQFYTQMLQLQYQLQPEVVGESTLNELVNDQLLKLEAAELGIEISQAQVDQELQNLFGYFPNGTPTAEATNTPVVFSTLSAQQLAILSPTPSLEPSATATVGPSATATLIPTVDPAITVQPTATLFPTATPITEAGYQLQLSEYYAQELSEMGLTEADIREIVYMTLLRQEFLDYVSKDVAHGEEQVWARHILVATQEEANAVIARLNAGEDFAAIAAEVSTDGTKDSGGDLGWFSKDAMVEPFANAAFELRVGQISEPVESEFGWHIVQVLGHEDRPLTQSQFQQRAQEAYDAYLLTLRDKYTVEIFDNWKGIVPTKPSIPALQ